MDKENPVVGQPALYPPSVDSGDRFVGNMTLRDFLAGMALMGLCQHYRHPSERDEGAHEAYSWADAMLKARDQRKGA